MLQPVWPNGFKEEDLWKILTNSYVAFKETRNEILPKIILFVMFKPTKQDISPKTNTAVQKWCIQLQRKKKLKRYINTVS